MHARTTFRSPNATGPLRVFELKMNGVLCGIQVEGFVCSPAVNPVYKQCVTLNLSVQGQLDVQQLLVFEDLLKEVVFGCFNGGFQPQDQSLTPSLGGAGLGLGLCAVLLEGQYLEEEQGKRSRGKAGRKMTVMTECKVYSTHLGLKGNMVLPMQLNV